MSIQHISPNMMYIELAGISAILAHLINQATNGNYITDEIAHHMSVYIFRYELNLRCLWVGVSRQSMGVIDIEKMVLDINISPNLKQFIIFNCADIFDRIEIAVNELLDLITKKETWDILTVNDCGPFSIQIINDGDYRVYEWAKQQKTLGTKFGRMYKSATLEL